LNFTAPNKAFIFKINWVHENVVTIKDAAFHQINYYGKCGGLTNRHKIHWQTNTNGAVHRNYFVLFPVGSVGRLHISSAILLACPA